MNYFVIYISSKGSPICQNTTQYNSEAHRSNLNEVNGRTPRTSGHGVAFQNNPSSQADFHGIDINNDNGIGVTELIFLKFFRNFHPVIIEAFNAVVKFIKRLSYILHPSHPPLPSFYEEKKTPSERDPFNNYYAYYNHSSNNIHESTSKMDYSNDFRN